jgi:hypothetical protein
MMARSKIRSNRRFPGSSPSLGRFGFRFEVNHKVKRKQAKGELGGNNSGSAQSQSAPFAIFIVPANREPNSMTEFTVRCPRCGLAVQRFIRRDQGQTEIEALAYVKTCQIAPERPAFDFNCPELELAISKSRTAPLGNNI